MKTLSDEDVRDLVAKINDIIQLRMETLVMDEVVNKIADRAIAKIGGYSVKLIIEKIDK